jgi:hypothetical protein
MVAKARDGPRLVVALNWLHVSHRWAKASFITAGNDAFPPIWHYIVL